jgi:dTDP-4-dehydrorhamnose 3,5-epimerase
MKFEETDLPGAFLVSLEKIEDERGYFARSWCANEFDDQGLESRLAQCNVSFNRTKGTLRGMHYQIPPFAETKLVRCTRGALFDVIIDLRPESATFTRWLGIELTPDNGMMVYVPAGFAHGFQTLMDRTEVFYQMSEFYSPTHGRGVRWDDPMFGIEWPLDVKVISERDRRYPDSERGQFLDLAGSAAIRS